MSRQVQEGGQNRKKYKINKGQLVGIKETQTMEQSNNLIYNS